MSGPRNSTSGSVAHCKCFIIIIIICHSELDLTALMLGVPWNLGKGHQNPESRISKQGRSYKCDLSFVQTRTFHLDKTEKKNHFLKFAYTYYVFSSQQHAVLNIQSVIDL